ncbi:NlpC/P60 family protein [Peptostreptococcus russellii]|uniref:C40 family peptidase n=1 Tax=Peptostreptococcus russellii TaxID=215200 RepID=UPI003F58D378
MQFSKKRNKKIIAVALVTMMMASGAGTLVSSADTVEQTEYITEFTGNQDSNEVTDNNSIEDNAADENISNINTNASSDGNTNLGGEQSSANRANSINGEIIQNAPDNVIEESSGLEANDLEMAAKMNPKSFNGFSKEDGKWYLYSNGVRQKGWVDYNGVRYYILNTYQLPQDMWRMIQGHKYYFNKDGVMIRDQKMSINGKIYQFNKEGHLIANDNTTHVGIMTEEQKALYAKGEKNLIDAEKNLKNGIFQENGKYYKYVNGQKTRGWYEEGNKKYYFLNTLNRAENMWRKIDGKLYYFDKNGVMYANTIKYIGTQTYKFNPDGSLNANAATTIALMDISIRTKADNSSQIIGKFIKGNGVEVIDKSGNYSKVRTGDGGITGWIPSNSIVTLSQEKINSVISVAKSKLGSPYVWGATGPSTFDCSGLMLYSFKNGANITLPRVSKHQATVGRYVSRSELRPGDMIFWGSPVHHVALYIGDGKYIHAPQPGDYVRIANLGSYTTARRVIE